ncbi:MAG: hypothetical protein M3139_12505 [Bacteroidota bacterium]|nr:hypothetical protein [Bacteroidota bacterium]
MKRAEVLAKFYDLTQNDQLTIMTAACFKDSCYLLTRTQDYAMMSYEIMRKFMEERSLKETEIHKINGCIVATKEAGKPTNLLEQIFTMQIPTT